MKNVAHCVMNLLFTVELYVLQPIAFVVGGVTYLRYAYITV